MLHLFSPSKTLSKRGFAGGIEARMIVKLELLGIKSRVFRLLTNDPSTVMVAGIFEPTFQWIVCSASVLTRTQETLWNPSRYQERRSTLHSPSGDLER